MIQQLSESPPKKDHAIEITLHTNDTKNADPSHSIPGRKELDPIGLRSLLIDYFGVRLVMVPPQSRPASHNLLLPKSRRYRWSRGESSRTRARGVWQAPRAHSLTVHAVLTCSLASGRDGGRVLAILSLDFFLTLLTPPQGHVIFQKLTKMMNPNPNFYSADGGNGWSALACAGRPTIGTREGPALINPPPTENDSTDSNDSNNSNDCFPEVLHSGPARIELTSVSISS